MQLFKRLLCLFLLCVTCGTILLACAPNDPAGVLRLAKEGKSGYRVVIAADASEDITAIAEEFVQYFARITEVKLPVVRDSEREERYEICIGRTNREATAAVNPDRLDEEEFVYRAHNRSLVLCGGSERGTIYAVYGFLEDELSVRYYSPDYEVVPQTDTVEVPLELSFRDAPVFWFRDMNEAGVDDKLWLVKMRINSNQSLGSETYRRDFPYGGGVGYAGWFVHTIGQLAEMKKSEKTNAYTNIQPCLTDETIYNTTLKNVRAWLDKYPDAKIISISQNDGTSEGAMCRCENCKEIKALYGGVSSAPWIWFVSRIANELKDEYPDVYFDTLAYNFTRTPPRRLEIPDNMIIRYCPAHCCMRHCFDTIDDVYGTAPERASTVFHQNFDAWQLLTENIFIWDYDALFYDYLSPQPDYTRIREDMNAFAKRKVKGVFMQGDSAGNNGFSELRAYLVAKLLWNPDMSEETYNALMDDFMNGYYGTGTAEPLHQYIDYIEDHTKYTDFTLYGYARDIFPIDTITKEDGTVYLDDTFVEDCKSYFDEAQSLVTDETQLLHLRKARIQIKYYEIIVQFYQRYIVTPSTVDYSLGKKLNESLYEDLMACGVKQFAEGYDVPENPNFNYAPQYWNR